MPATLTINNYSPPNIVETTDLSADASATASPVGLSVTNNQNFAANDYIIIGALGSETSELKQVTSVTGTGTITVPSLDRGHSKYDKVTKLFGNQIVVYRAANVDNTQPLDASFAVFTGSTVAIDVDQTATIFTDANGSSSYWYKFIYSNSTSSQTTSLADSMAARGQNYNNYCSIEDIRQETSFTKARYITDTMIDVHRQAAQAAINSALLGIYTVPFQAPVNALIKSITKRMAGAWLLMEQYGRQTTSYQNAKDMLASVTNKELTGDLDKLVAGKTTLTDVTGASIARSDSSTGANGWPNDTTATANTSDAGGDFLFRIGNVRNEDRAY